MDNVDKIAPALLAAQKAMSHAAKSATNPHFKSKYADLATVIDAVKGPLNDAGIVFMQTIGNTTEGVQVTTTLLHESGQSLESTIYLPVPQQTPQAYGSGITYAKRYALQSMCGLPSEDDDGERASEPEKEDAHRVEPGPGKMKPKEFIAHCTAMANCTKMESLQKAFTAAVLAARAIGDEGAVKSFSAKKDQLKEVLFTVAAKEMFTPDELGGQG